MKTFLNIIIKAAILALIECFLLYCTFYLFVPEDLSHFKRHSLEIIPYLVVGIPVITVLVVSFFLLRKNKIYIIAGVAFFGSILCGVFFYIYQLITVIEIEHPAVIIIGIVAIHMPYFLLILGYCIFKFVKKLIKKEIQYQKTHDEFGISYDDEFYTQQDKFK